MSMYLALNENPLAFLLIASLIGAGIALVAVVVWIAYINAKYPTKAARREWKRDRPRDGAITLLSLGLVAVLAAGVVGSVGQIVAYNHDVREIQRWVDWNTGSRLSAADAKRLLGNDYDYVVKPITAGKDNVVGQLDVKNHHAVIKYVSPGKYELSIQKISKD